LTILRSKIKYRFPAGLGQVPFVLEHKICSFLPPGEPPGIPPGKLPGGKCVRLSSHDQSRGHRTLRFDPGDLPCLTEAVLSATCFPGVNTRRIIRSQFPDPRSSGQRGGVSSHGRQQRALFHSLRIDPDCQHCVLTYDPTVDKSSYPRLQFSLRLPAFLGATLLPECRWPRHTDVRYRVGSRRLRRLHVRAAGFSWTSPAALLKWNAPKALSFSILSQGATSGDWQPVLGLFHLSVVLTNPRLLSAPGGRRRDRVLATDLGLLHSARSPCNQPWVRLLKVGFPIVLSGPVARACPKAAPMGLHSNRGVATVFWILLPAAWPPRSEHGIAPALW
jgi:hypothetical protein